MKIAGLLRGGNTRETVERYIILGIIAGVVMTGAGIVSTIFATKGLPSAVALIGSFITFVFTVILVFFWFFMDERKAES